MGWPTTPSRIAWREGVAPFGRDIDDLDETGSYSVTCVKVGSPYQRIEGPHDRAYMEARRCRDSFGE